jgi:peptidoglycan hydrolase-like protein with peptidoglycan-binding domain
LIDQNIGEKGKKLKNFGITGYFGWLTKDALAEYQIKNKILPANGYFGKITKNYLKSIGN